MQTNRTAFWICLAAGASTGALLSGLFRTAPLTTIAADAGARTNTDEVVAMRAEVERLKGMVPDQSHVMSDVGYHFQNLWFAAQSKNWPLAKFYFDETRSHLNWAVRIIPVRKTRAGEDVDLKAILQAIDTGPLKQVGQAIERQSTKDFPKAYQDTLEGCYSCHKASEKPYLRPRVPEIPGAPIINTDPGADWPP